ncbi:hypothetical protein [Aquimarina sp. RZ0]|uniref:hypothetical protein n=1 Tax=Aquimarina sp. RZ0 TaxID=2607730 RepID=UPI0011F175E9|nr:hypothetical protein [Aquimarina sp. RZ0]KAA1246070.1 hypothetical protein F0000_09475 [Aquimarina sp. RZ0]
MKNKEYLLNMGFFYCTVIPDEGKCYSLNVENSKHADIQKFINNEVVDYSKYELVMLPYDEKENWTSYLESKNPVTYHSVEHLSQEQFIERLILKKHADGILVAVKDFEKQKVKVYKKNLPLNHEETIEN